VTRRTTGRSVVSPALRSSERLLHALHYEVEGGTTTGGESVARGESMRAYAVLGAAVVAAWLQASACLASDTVNHSTGLTADVGELVPLGDLSESRSSGAVGGLKLVTTYFQAGFHFATLGRHKGGESDNLLLLDAGLRLPISDDFAVSAGGGTGGPQSERPMTGTCTSVRMSRLAAQIPGPRTSK
jgi:hypothetical protein